MSGERNETVMGERNMQIYFQKRKCYGCGKCSIECPQNSIIMQADEEGFMYPYVDEDKCINCGKCLKGCIANVESKFHDRVDEVYACMAIEEDILAKSTSGGVGYLLAREAIKANGIVYGAAFNDGHAVEHVRIENKEELYKIQGTKYVQSDIVSALTMMMKDMEECRRICFFGTPCQIAAVKALAGEYENIICVELVCMGCPSPLVWEKHLQDYQSKYGNIDAIKFRDKVSGWKTSSISYYMGKNGGNRRSYRGTEDAYLSGFAQALFLRPSCHECRFKGHQTYGDIKIGDFWGIENYDDKYKNTNGISLVLIETCQGRVFFEQIHNQIEEKKMDYKFAVLQNPYVQICKKPSKQRRLFFAEMVKQDGINMDEIIVRHLNPAFDQKERYWYQYPIVDTLLKLHIQQNGIRNFFEKNNYYKVVIYGIGDLGKTFLKMLQIEGVNVQCLIDKNYKRFSRMYAGIPVIGPHELEKYDYDCVVVSLVHLYNSALETLIVQGVDLNKIISIGSVVECGLES